MVSVKTVVFVEIVAIVGTVVIHIIVVIVHIVVVLARNVVSVDVVVVPRGTMKCVCL